MRRIAKKDLLCVTLSVYRASTDDSELQPKMLGDWPIETMPALRKRVEKWCQWFLDTPFVSGEDCHRVRITKMIVVLRLVLKNGERVFIAYATDTGWIDDMSCLPSSITAEDILLRPINTKGR